MACTHDGYHSISSEYDRGRGLLRYFRSCDECGERLKEVHGIEYRPAFNPSGNDEYLTQPELARVPR